MEEKGSEENQTRINKYALACAFIASVISIIFGYDTGVMSGAMIFIKEDLELSDRQLEVLAGILNLCSLLGSLAAGRTSDYIGRRYTIALSSLIFLLGALIMSYGSSFAVLMFGRCTAGVGVGFALMIAPVYTAEISSPSSRGVLTSLPELCISVGILLGYVSNYFFSKLPMHLGWRVMLGLAGVPSIILSLGILNMPESPRWLVMQGRLVEAERILLRVSNTNEEAVSRFRDIKAAAQIHEEGSPGKGHSGEGVWRDLLLRPTPAVRRILIAAIGINFFEHATGIEAVVLYSPRIFHEAGVTNKNKKKLLIATVGLGITKTVFISVATFLLDRVGRRRLLLISAAGMAMALTGLGLGLTVAERSKDRILWAFCLSIASTYAFVGLFSIGLGPVTWVYNAEIFPLKLRAQGVSIGVAVNRVMNAVVSMTFISIYKAITIGGSFFMFAGVSVLAWVFFYFQLPETKGRALEEMEMLFTVNIRDEDHAPLEMQARKLDAN